MNTRSVGILPTDERQTDQPINVDVDLPMGVDIKIFALNPVSWDDPCEDNNCTLVMWAHPGVLPTTALLLLGTLVSISTTNGLLVKIVH